MTDNTVTDETNPGAASTNHTNPGAANMHSDADTPDALSNVHALGCREWPERSARDQSSQSQATQPAADQLTTTDRLATDSVRPEALPYNEQIDLLVEFMESYYQLDFMSMDVKVATDPRTETAKKLWTICMRESGYPGYEFDTFESSVVRDYRTKLDSITSVLNPLSGMSDEEILDLTVNMTKEELLSFLTPPSEAKIDQTALNSLQNDEKRLAVAHAHCLTDYQAGTDLVIAEYEQYFIEENRDALERIKMLISQMQSYDTQQPQPHDTYK